MKYIIAPAAKLIACVLMAQVAAFAYCIVFAWSLSHKSAKREAGTVWSMRFEPEGCCVMVVCAAAMFCIPRLIEVINSIVNEAR